MNQRGQMSLFVPGLGQHGMQQYGTPSQKQIQIIQQQQQLLMHEIALKKAQLVQQQQQHHLSLLKAQQQAQQQQQAMRQQGNPLSFAQQQQHCNSFRFQAMNRAKASPSPDCSSRSSSPILNYNSHRNFDHIEDWEIPSHDLMQKIVQQVEYYFSNEYLTRDAYFLRQIRRKREGYLSMKLITNFKKVRKVVKDPRITSYCLRQSETLQVNEDGTKVRRIAQIPEDLRRFAVSRSLLVTKVPLPLCSIEALMSIFYQFGDISSVRILRPGKEIPHDLRDILGKMVETMPGISAVVEFETAEAASSAYSRFSLKSDFNIDSKTYDINVNLLGIDSEGRIIDDDSGCGESASSGDESSFTSGQDLSKLINTTNSEDLEDDYEAYMNEIRKERQTENKTNVPEFISSLMEEYGSGSTVPSPNAPSNSSAVVRRPSPFSENFGPNVIGPVRGPFSSKSSLWSTNWESEETDTELKSLLADSALSAFGNIKFESDDVFNSDTNMNLIAPSVTQSSNQVQTRGWADAVRN